MVQKQLAGPAVPAAGASERPQGGVLVAVTFDAPSVVALRRGHHLALQLGLPLRVVHVEALESAPTRGHDARDRVLTWAAVHAGITLSAGVVTVRAGKPVAEIWREANGMNASLLVLGGAVVGCGQPGWLVRFLAQHARRPVLVASDAHRPSIVAATDLTDGSLPVLHYAAALAERGGWFLRGVHNSLHAPRVAVREDDCARRSSPVGDELAPDDLLIDEVEITADEAPSDAILRVARASDSDIVAVGSHETSGRTLRELVLRARRSVLAVPLGAARRRGSRPGAPR